MERLQCFAPGLGRLAGLLKNMYMRTNTARIEVPAPLAGQSEILPVAPDTLDSGRGKLRDPSFGLLLPAQAMVEPLLWSNPFSGEANRFGVQPLGRRISPSTAAKLKTSSTAGLYNRTRGD